MNSTLLKRSYMMLSGIVVVMTVLIVYMWTDARKIEQSLLRKTEMSPQVSMLTTVRVESMGKVSPKPIAPLQQNHPERRKTVKEQFRSQNTLPVTSYTDDWIFKRAESMEAEEELAKGEAIISSE